MMARPHLRLVVSREGSRPERPTRAWFLEDMMNDAHLKKITLHLARTREHPDGSARHGYEIFAPLTADGHIDADAWKAVRARCFVHRFWGSEPTERGLLVHRPGGVKGATWSIDYDHTTDADDEDGFRFGDHVFQPGEYVSIRDAEGEMQTFRIASVAAA
jgi:hypothetical protein